MKRNCTTCKKSNDGMPCDPPERSAAAQWQAALPHTHHCDCLDHEPRPVKHKVAMEIEPYVDKEGKEWCWHSSEKSCSAFTDKCPLRDRKRGQETRPQACIDAEVDDDL
jgi:hypothetical protein